MHLEENFEATGKRIFQMRERLGLTQAQFAGQLGVDRKSVAGWEAGKRLPDGASLLGLMRVFGADVNYLLSGSGSAPAHQLSAEEQTLLGYFRVAPAAVRRAALGALLGASAPAAPVASATNHGAGTQQINIGDGAVMIGNAAPVRKRQATGKGETKSA